jgi:N-acetylglucosamine malate deacetylase 1
MISNQKILILSPHTDDAELGCGGTISRLIEDGNKIHWIVFSTAEESLPAEMPPNTLVNEFRNVAAYFNLADEDIDIYHFNVRKLNERRQDVLEILVKTRNSLHPDIVIGPSLHDFHQDHGVVANEMIRAFKTSASIICYELPWNHIKFDTQYFMKLEERHILKKIEMLKFYKSQTKANRHYFSEDFIKGLAFTRGAQIGYRFAEAFEVIRWIS